MDRHGFYQRQEQPGDRRAVQRQPDGEGRVDRGHEYCGGNGPHGLAVRISEFARLAAENLGKDGEQAAALQNYIDEDPVIYNKAVLKNRVGRELSESKGFAVYLPPVEARIPQEKLESIFEGKYTDFAFDKAAGWHKFVTFLYGVK